MWFKPPARRGNRARNRHFNVFAGRDRPHPLLCGVFFCRNGMDSLTQAVLGAGIQGAMLGRFHGRKAMVAGALLATLPDLDVLIDYGDPISGMINHRGFSHSLFVLTGVSVLLTWLVRRWRPSPDYG